MICTFFCVNTPQPQMLNSASALCHVSRRCCVGMPPSTDLPPCLSQVKVVPSRCSCTVCARSPEAHRVVPAPRVDEPKLFRGKNNKQGIMKIKTASPCFGQINIGITMSGMGGNHRSSQGRARGACIAEPVVQKAAPWPWLRSMGDLPLPGGCREAHQPHQAVSKGQPPCLSPVPLWGHPCSHHNAAPIREMALGTQSSFPNGTGHCSAVPGVQEDGPALLLDKSLSFIIQEHFSFSFFHDKWLCAGNKLVFMKKQITIKVFL